MKIVRFLDSAAKIPLWGVLEGERVRVLAGAPYDGLAVTNASHALGDLHLLPPADPSKIVCGGLNYHEHAKEVGLSVPRFPVCFLKPPTSLIGHGDPIEYPVETERLEFEAELAVVIKRRMRNVPPELVLDHVLGYTCANDVTARDIQFEGGNLLNTSVAKSFDTFCPIGPCLATDLDPGNLEMRLTSAGQIRQKTNTNDMIFSVQAMLSYYSHVMTLLPGDLILTGTPTGVGRMEIGRTYDITIDGVGTLSNPVVASARRTDAALSV